MSNKNGGSSKLKTVVTYSSLGLVTATGLILAARLLIKKIKKSSAEKNSLKEGDPSTYARQLKMAFDNDNWAGWGTNTKMVMQVFTDIPSKSAYQKVQNAYLGLYNKSLNADLESELSSDEYNQVIKILSSKK